MKERKKIIHLILLTIIYIFSILLITRFKFYFASVTDTLKQHAVFPDYFRNLFYETGNIMPSFAPHLGAGQNTFYFAYYGYLNPIILISYLIPFISMKTYILISTLILNYISILLMYYFLSKNNFNNTTSFIGSLLLLLATPLMFHAHRHIMFVNFFSFLILSLIGVYNYFTKHKSLLLIINTSLLIFTSFYFSITGIITIFLYALFMYLKLNDFNIKDFIKEAFRFILCILIAILISAIILMPTLYIILNSERSSSNINILSTLIPKINGEFLFYNSYGLGLTSIFLIALIYGILNKKRHYKVLSIILSIIITIPLFNMILNGGLYLNGKSFIPILPLFILLICNLIQNKKLEFNYKFIILLLIFIILMVKNKIFLIFLIDLTITLIALYLYFKRKNNKFLIPIIIIAGTCFITVNLSDKLITFEEIKDINNIDNYNFLDNDSNIYRFENYLKEDYHLNYSKAKNDYLISLYSSTSNPYYKKSFYNDFNVNDRYRNEFMLSENNNLFFEYFMGVKYILTDKNIPYGYKLAKKEKLGGFYQNENVNKIGFATNNIISEYEYDNLEFNKQLESFGNYIIVKNADLIEKDNFLSQEINLNYEIDSKNIEYKENNGTIKLDAKNNNYLKLNLKENLSNPLIIRFKVKPSNAQDLKININGITNKLTNKTWKYYNNNETFDYIISSNEDINSLNITFSKGLYEISDIKTYIIPKEYFDKFQDNKDYININGKITDTLEGDINVTNNGYFIFTIPFDKGFNIFVDDKKVDYELVNKAFIGFKIDKGYHNIKLTFTSPYFNIGKDISLMGLIFLLILIYKEKKI